MASVRTFMMVAILIGIALSDGCHKPTLDRTELTAIRSEALLLLRSHASPSYLDGDQPDLPATIRNLRADRIVLRRHYVDVIAKDWFDGGWGYYVSDGMIAPPSPSECYSAIGENIYWHSPC